MNLMKTIAISALALIAVSALNASKAEANSNRLCATVYQAEFAGHSMPLASGTQIPDLGIVAMGDGGSWNNRISSVVVEPGCTFVGYQYLNFGRHFRTGDSIGFALNLVGSHHHHPHHCDGHHHHGHHGWPNHSDLAGTFYDEKISSLTCFCR
jgi:hypothetical protein